MALTDKLKEACRGLKRKLSLYRLVLKDPRTPALPKALLWIAIGYTLLPFDLIPDFLPVIGHIDDVIIVPLLVVLALRLIPVEIIEDCERKLAEHPAAPTSSTSKTQ